MAWKQVLVALILVALTETKKGRKFSCEKASSILDKCRKGGYEIENCEVGNGKLKKSFRKKCGRVMRVHKKKCEEYKCDQKGPGQEGWKAIDIKPEYASQFEDPVDGMQTKFMIYSAPAPYENSKTVAEYKVKILKPFTLPVISLSPTVEFLNENDEVIANIYNRLWYFVMNDGDVKVQGWVSMYVAEGRNRCRTFDEVKTFPKNEGPAVSFIPDEVRYEAKFSGDRTVTVDFVKQEFCKEEDTNAFKAAMSSAKKVRFLLDAGPHMVDVLGDFVGVEYRFVDRS